MNAEDIGNVLLSNFVKDWLDVRLGVGDSLCSHHPFEDLIGVTFTLIINDTWTVDEVDAFGQGDVLPDLGLSRDGRHLAARLFHQRVDD